MADALRRAGAAVPAGGLAARADGPDAADPDRLIAWVRTFFRRAYHDRNAAAIDELVAPDIVVETEGAVRVGAAVARGRVETILAAFDPVAHRMQSVTAEDGVVTARWEADCTQIGPFLGVPPAGRVAVVRCTTVMRFEGGRVVRIRDDFDADAFLRQLRGLPPRPF